MTIINPNSISGISSITALNSTAAINLFKADGTSANIIAGVTTGSNFITGTSNVHSTGYECTNINASGIVTAATLDISGDIDFDGQTNLDHVSISGVTTTTGNITIDGLHSGASPRMLNIGSCNNILRIYENSSQAPQIYTQGDLVLTGATTEIRSKSGSNQLEASFHATNGVKLYHNNNEKLFVNDGGVDITGDLTIAENIVHAGDTNTKIRFPANDEISLETSGHDQLYIKADGKIGMGTVTPSTNIHNFSDGLNGNSIRLENREGYVTFTNDANGLYLDADSHYIRSKAGSAYLNIDSSGRTLAYGTLGSGNLPISGNAANAAIQIRCQSKYQGIGFGEGATNAVIGRGANNGALVFVANAHPANLGGGAKTTFEWWSGSAGGSGPSKIMGMEADGKLTIGDGNELASSYDANLLLDGGSGSQLTLLGATTGWSKIAFADGSGSTGAKNAGFIYMQHSTSNNGPNLSLGLQDVNKVTIRDPGSNRGQLELYGNFNESTAAAIEINDNGDARKAFITNSSGDLNLLTRNGSQTKGQLKMFESGVFFHAQKDPDSTNVLQTFRAQTYRNQTGSTNPSISPDQRLIQKGGSGTYDCFYEGNMTLTVNGGGNDHYQPVAFVPLGYDLDTTSFGGQWAGEMWIHQNGSQNPENYGYSGYNNWATMTFKCKWDCAHWNAKPNGFWVEHYLNTGRAQIGKIDAATTMSQFVIYLLPGFYHIRYNCVRGMAVHRSSSNGGSITLQDGGSHATYSTLAYSSRNTAFDSEITSGSASMTHST